MASLNKVMVIGNCGKDPEVRYSQSGAPISSFSVAATEKWTKDGEKQERTEWVNVTAFGKLAEIVRDYVTKGKQVYIEGSLRTDEWEDRDGNKRRSTKVVLSGPGAKLVLLGGRGERQAASHDETQPSDPAQDFQASDDDIPF
jgi:single-strand DNA-binding protein